MVEYVAAILQLIDQKLLPLTVNGFKFSNNFPILLERLLPSESSFWYRDLETGTGSVFTGLMD